MPELNLEPQHLCASSDLKECEGSVTFEVLEFGRVASAFAVRFDNQALGYLNRCAHVPAEMDWQPGEFWDQDRRFIICAVHGALYDPPNGLCVMGPCRGKKLIPVRLEEKGGQVYWYPDDQFQPVF
jgi:nitrite reductase/ring-hydroxylating ferredoxin subunit